MSASIGHKAATGAIWASIDRFGFMALQFGVNLILARLLTPADFGIIGMLAIFIAVSQVLIDGGFASALIQKQFPTQADYSTIFFWNLTFSLFLYLILFFCSPLVAKFYSMPILNDVLKTIGLNLIITSVLSIQMTRLRKQLEFKKIAITNISSYIIGASVAIFLANNGFGVWSLVVMQLFNSSMSIAILWFLTKWYPSLCFSKNTMKELFSFGGYIMAASILQEICKNLQGIIIGKKFSATQMGYYSQAYKLDQVSSYSIPQVIVQVMYPVYSSLQEDKEKLSNVLAMNIRVISFIIFPLIGLLILIADPLIFLLYGEKWMPCVPYYKILCVGGLFVCLQNVNFYAVAAIGKSKSLFYWSFYKWGILIAALLIGMNFGMTGLLWGMVLSSINIYIVNASLVSKHIGVSLIKQFSLIFPILILVLIAMFVSQILYIKVWAEVLHVVIYLSVFMITAKLLNLKSLRETIKTINMIVKNTTK